MGRRYVVPFENIAVSAAQDLLQIKGASNKMLKVIRCWWGATDTAAPTAQQVQTRCRNLPATVTDGNGAGVTPVKTDPGDAAATFTAIRNSTTQASTSGTAAIQDESGDHLYNGYQSKWSEKEAPVVPPSTSFVMEILSTVSGTVHMSGGALVEEVG